MNKKIKNLILYGLLVLVVIGFSITSLFGKELLWKPENNKEIPFSGIYFDVPENVTNFKIRRSETQGLTSDLISYDVEFEYIGSDSSMRIMGKLAEQSFFGEEVTPRHSKATLKGEYDKINNLLFDEKLTHRELFKNIDNYKFSSISEIRVPLSESIKDYKFKISYEPKSLIYSENDEIAKASVFLTNARVDNFTDGDYVNKSETQSFNESGMYVNAIEIYNEDMISNIGFWRNVNNVIFIVSVILTLGLIWLDRQNSQYFIILLMLISILTSFRFMEVGVSTLGALVIMPILGVLAVLVGRQMPRERISFNKYDFSQSLLGAFSMLFLGMVLYLIPKII